MKKRELPNYVIEKAVQIYASDPMIQHQEVAKLLSISEKKLRSLRRQQDFHRRVYDYYMTFT